MLLNKFPGGGVSIEAATATPSKVLSPFTFFAGENEEIQTGDIPSKTAQTYTPGTSDQTITAGQYLSGDQTIAGDADLIPANIRTGKSIFGVDGTGPGLPTSIVAGDTPIYAPAAGVMILFNTNVWADTGVGFTALRDGIYRVKYGAANYQTYSQAKLKRNGVDVDGSLLQSASASFSTLIIDVLLVAGDVLAWWGRSTSENKSVIAGFSVSISMPEIQGEFDMVITPR